MSVFKFKSKRVNVIELLPMNKTHLNLLCSFGSEYQIFSVMGKAEWHLKFSFIQQTYIDDLLGIQR